MTTQSNDQIVAEMEWTIQAIEIVTGARPKFARPPYGDIDDRVRGVIKSMGMEPLLWDRDTHDWTINTPGSKLSLIEK